MVHFFSGILICIDAFLIRTLIHNVYSHSFSKAGKGSITMLHMFLLMYAFLSFDRHRFCSVLIYCVIKCFCSSRLQVYIVQIFLAYTERNRFCFSLKAVIGTMNCSSLSKCFWFPKCPTLEWLLNFSSFLHHYISERRFMERIESSSVLYVMPLNFLDFQNLFIWLPVPVTFRKDLKYFRCEVFCTEAVPRKYIQRNSISNLKRYKCCHFLALWGVTTCWLKSGEQ